MNLTNTNMHEDKEDGRLVFSESWRPPTPLFSNGFADGTSALPVSILGTSRVAASRLRDSLIRAINEDRIDGELAKTVAKETARALKIKEYTYGQIIRMFRFEFPILQELREHDHMLLEGMVNDTFLRGDITMEERHFLVLADGEGCTENLPTTPTNPAGT